MIYLILILFFGAIFIHLIYWVVVFFPLKLNVATSIDPPSHSTVSCYKNEEDKLGGFLKFIKKQKSSQIILVDDFSTDRSSASIDAESDPRLLYAKATKDRPGKKNALLTGVNNSDYEFMILTDVDCMPATKEWSTIMTRKLIDADAVLGYGPMTKEDGSIALFSRYETYLTAIQYLSYAQKGIPYMGVGRNMAIKKTIALPHLDRISNDELASGDDDMLIQSMAAQNQVITTSLDPKSFVFSKPSKDLKSYISQKSRHISTSTAYHWSHKILLGVFAGTHIASYILFFCVAVLFPSWFKIVLSGLIIKWAVQFMVNFKLMDILKEKDMVWKTPILDIATFVYYIVLTPYLILRNKKKWN